MDTRIYNFVDVQSFVTSKLKILMYKLGNTNCGEIEFVTSHQSGVSIIYFGMWTTL